MASLLTIQRPCAMSFMYCRMLMAFNFRFLARRLFFHQSPASSGVMSMRVACGSDDMAGLGVPDVRFPSYPCIKLPRLWMVSSSGTYRYETSLMDDSGEINHQKVPLPIQF